MRYHLYVDEEGMLLCTIAVRELTNGFLDMIA
jgi:hypothetical protein